MKNSENMVSEGEGWWRWGSKERSILLEFRLKGGFRMLQAEVCELRMALTRRLYGTVAVMSSVMSHSGTVVGEHLLLGIQMWLMNRLSYSLAKERKAQCHTGFSHPGSTMVASNCLIHLLFMGQQNKHLLQTLVPSPSSQTNQPFFLTPFMTRQRKPRHKSQCVQISPSPRVTTPITATVILCLAMVS